MTVAGRAAHFPSPIAEPNLAHRFVRAAASQPDRMALAMAGPRGDVREMTFAELDRTSDAYAHGLRREGLRPGDRVLLLMKPGTHWIALVLGLIKSGIIAVIVDPGMDRSSLLACIESASPTALVGTPTARVFSALGGHAFAGVRKRWLAGWPWAPGAVERLARIPPLAEGAFPVEPIGPDATLAIVFTTGSTGVPKGVVYTHANYAAQIDLLARRFSIEPGEVALPGYLPFAMLCLCMGSPCVVPSYRAARPASVEPGPVMGLVRRYRPSYGLGSPAFWSRIAQYGVRAGEKLDGMRLLLLFGAEVEPSILRDLRGLLPGGAEIHTPYGSTEAQPITTVSDRELLDPSVSGQRSELGVCVGMPLDGVEVELVRITDGPLGENERIAASAIGEIAVRGAMVTGSYFRQPEQDRLQKIGTGPAAWHRMGDCGSFDADGRLWLAGRKAHRVETRDGLLFPLPVEARVNQHPAVRRSALVGVGPRGSQRPVLVVELSDARMSDSGRGSAAAEIVALAATEGPARFIREVFFHPGLPVDYRHNAKIQRDVLARWVQGQP